MTPRLLTRWVVRVVLVIGALVVGYWGTFFAFANFFWGDSTTPETFPTPQDQLNMLTVSGSVGLAMLVFVKTKGITEGSFQRDPRAWRRVLISLGIGLTVGVITMAIVNNVLDITGWWKQLDWGVIDGLFSALVAFGVSQTTLTRRDHRKAA